MWLALMGVVWAGRTVICDPTLAIEMTEEAGVDVARLPLTHPELLPGLVLASSDVGQEVRKAFEGLCDGMEKLTPIPDQRWDAPGWSAYTVVFTRRLKEGCAYTQQGLVLSIGVTVGEPPVYELRSVLPETRTPLAGCDLTPLYREDDILEGAESTTRLVLRKVYESDEIVNSAILVRQASARGWSENILMSPAPSRMLGGTDGPEFALMTRGEDRWVVASGDRRITDAGCEALPGQMVWIWDEGWAFHEGREALTLLASRGAHGLAGEEGWLVILAQDDDSDMRIMRERANRVEKAVSEDIHVFPSAWFPLLNPGFLVMTPGPWPDEAAARAGRRRMGRAGGRIKQAWATADSCL